MPGLTHEKPWDEWSERPQNYTSSPAFGGASDAIPERVSAEQAELPTRPHALALALSRIASISVAFETKVIKHAIDVPALIIYPATIATWICAAFWQYQKWLSLGLAPLVFIGVAFWGGRSLKRRYDKVDNYIAYIRVKQRSNPG